MYKLKLYFKNHKFNLGLKTPTLINIMSYRLDTTSSQITL